MVLRGTGRLEAGCDLAADLVVTAGWLGRTGRGAWGSLPPSAQKEPQPASQAGRKPRHPGAWGTWKGPLCVLGDLESTCLRARLLPGRVDGWSEQTPHSGHPGCCPAPRHGGASPCLQSSGLSAGHDMVLSSAL